MKEEGSYEIKMKCYSQARLFHPCLQNSRPFGEDMQNLFAQGSVLLFNRFAQKQDVNLHISLKRQSKLKDFDIFVFILMPMAYTLIAVLVFADEIR